MTELINLDECVINALNLYIAKGVPEWALKKFNRPLVVGSGNAQITGKILFEDCDAVVADESTYQRRLEQIPSIDGAVIISASGGKHAPILAEDLKQRGIEPYLLTCKGDSPAAKVVGADRTIVFPSNEEPITYNTSTYLGMLLSKTGEDPNKILWHISSAVKPGIDGIDFTQYDAFFLLVQPEFDAIREMFLTKFDELFQPVVSGRCFTVDQTIHAKTVIPSPKEMFISFGYENNQFGDPSARLNIPLPAGANYGALMMAGYFVVGCIQAQHPPYFKENASRYAQEQKRLFGLKEAGNL